MGDEVTVESMGVWKVIMAWWPKWKSAVRVVKRGMERKISLLTQMVVLVLVENNGVWKVTLACWP